MSGGLEDLSFELKAEMDKALSDLQRLGTQLSDVRVDVAKVNAAFRSIDTSQVRTLTDTVRAVDFTNITNGTQSLYSISSAADSAASIMDGMSVSVEAVDHAVTALAFSSTAAASALQTTATVSTAAAPAFTTAAHASTSLARTLHAISDRARIMTAALAGAASIVRATAGVITHVAHSMHAVLIVTDLLTTAFKMLMVPVQMVWSVAVAAFTALATVIRVVLSPVQLLWSGLVMLATAVWNVVQPILSLSVAVAKVWFIFKGWIGAIKLIFTWMALLPPKVRLLVGGLLALGAAGKVGAIGLKGLTFTIGVLAGTARLATNAVRLLSLPILAIVNPAAAARNAMLLMGAAASFAGKAALAATSKIYGLAASVGRLAASGIRSVVSGFASMGASIAKLGPQIAAFGVLAATAIGTKFAVATEKNSAVFGIMLKDMQQGEAVVKSLQGTKAAKLFDNQELLDSGRLLFKAGIGASDLAGKTEQLATIAAATSTELGDLSRIYMQGANSGSFQQDSVNQLAERGIDIYHALEAATGKSGAALKDMISSGQIGITEMDTALAHLTEGNGIYAGSLDVMANTTAGKFAVVKNNVTQSLGEIMGVALEIFQPFLSSIVEMSARLKATFEEFREPIMWAATAVAWLFKNFVDLSRFAFLSFSLFSVKAFNDFIYFFTDAIPAYLTWFGDNWKRLFVDMGNIYVTFYTNMYKNIAAVMRAIWDYIASGGTAEMKVAFTPLLEGFEATVSKLPDIPERAMTDLEKQLSSEIESLGGTLANDFDAMLTDTTANMNRPDVKLSGSPASASGKTGGDGLDTASKEASRRAVENKASMVRSSEGQSVVAQLAKAMGKGDDTKKQTKALQTTADKLTNIEREVRDGRRLVGRAFA